MLRAHIKFAILLLALNAGCNSGASGLDRGRVKVNGLSPQASKLPIVSRAQGSRTSLSLGQFQTRQTISFKLPDDFTTAGSSIDMIRKRPEPEQSVFTNLLIPNPGASATASNVTMIRDADGVATVSFYAGLLIRAGVVTYGDNIIQLDAKNNEETVQTLELKFNVRDFNVGGLAITGFTRPSQSSPQASGQISEQGDFQGWLSLLTVSSVAEVSPSGPPQSFMQSEFFRIINP